MTGTPAGLQACAAAWTAVICGAPDAGDDAGRADRARTHADLDGVGAGVDERLGALARRDVAADDLDVTGRRVALEPLRPSR